VKDVRGDIGSVVRENHGGLGKEGRGDKCVYIWSRYTGLPENPHRARWDRRREGGRNTGNNAPSQDIAWLLFLCGH